MLEVRYDGAIWSQVLHTKYGGGRCGQRPSQIREQAVETALDSFAQVAVVHVTNAGFKNYQN